MANNMADRKKNGTRTQTAELKTREKRVPTTKEEIKSTPAPARTEESVSAGEEGIKSTLAPARPGKNVPTGKVGAKSTSAPARTGKSAPDGKEETKVTPAPARTDKSAKGASTSGARRETVKREPTRQEAKASSRRDAKAPSTFTRLRNSKSGRFIYDAYYELRYKVNWPTFEEARNMAVLVVIISAVLGLLIAGTDFGLYRLFQLITTGK